LLRTFEPIRKKWSPMKILLCVIGVCILLVVLVLIFNSGGKSDRLEPSVGTSEKPEAPEGKKKKDPKSILVPIEPTHRCECRRCKEWREYRRKPWLKPRKDDYVKGCSSHLMEWHQVVSKKDGHVLEGPGQRFIKPGVICDICQKDFAKVSRKLWQEKKEVLHSWTCYQCIWEDPDRYVRYRDPNSTKPGQMEKRHAVNHGIDVCSVCAEQCPDQIRTFTELGPEGKLLHPGHPGDHMHAHKDKQSLVREMRDIILKEGL